MNEALVFHFARRDLCETTKGVRLGSHKDHKTYAKAKENKPQHCNKRLSIQTNATTVNPTS